MKKIVKKRAVIVGIMCLTVLVVVGQTYAADIPLTGLKYWFKADTGVTVDGSGYVSDWDNLADGTGATDAVQATQARKPLLVADGINGKPVIRFDGLDDIMIADSPIADETYLDVFVVAKYRSATSDDTRLMIGMSSYTDNNRYAATADEYFKFQSVGGVNLNNVTTNEPAGARNRSVDNGAVDTDPHIFSMEHICATSVSNIVDDTTVTDTTDPLNALWLIGQLDIGAMTYVTSYLQHCDVDIAEIILYNSVYPGPVPPLTDAQRAEVTSYLWDKYDIPEPATLSLVGMGGLLALLRKKR